MECKPQKLSWFLAPLFLPTATAAAAAAPGVANCQPPPLHQAVEYRQRGGNQHPANPQEHQTQSRQSHQPPETDVVVAAAVVVAAVVVIVVVVVVVLVVVVVVVVVVSGRLWECQPGAFHVSGRF